MQVFDDADEMVGRLQAVTARPGGGWSWDRVRSVIFRTLHLMAERRGNKRPSNMQNLISALLLAFDGFQVVCVIASPEFGYGYEEFAWLESISLTRALNIRLVGLTWALVFWSISSFVLALALANALLVAWQVASGHSGSVWPMRTLRAFVSVVLTALFIPLFQSTARFLSCEQMTSGALAAGDTPPECWSLLHGALFGVSALVLAAFVPFALLVRAIFFNDTPTAGSIVAKPLARADMLDTLCRTTIVLVGLFITEDNRLAILLCVALLYTWLLVVSAHHLPFYKRVMTAIRVGQVTLYAELAVGAVVLELARSNGATLATQRRVAMALLIGMPVAMVLGGLFAWRRLLRMKSVAMQAAEEAIRNAIKNCADSSDGASEDSRSEGGKSGDAAATPLGSARPSMSHPALARTPVAAILGRHSRNSSRRLGRITAPHGDGGSSSGAAKPSTTGSTWPGGTAAREDLTASMQPARPSLVPDVLLPPAGPPQPSAIAPLQPSATASASQPVTRRADNAEPKQRRASRLPRRRSSVADKPSGPPSFLDAVRTSMGPRASSTIVIQNKLPPPKASEPAQPAQAAMHNAKSQRFAQRMSAPNSPVARSKSPESGQASPKALEISLGGAMKVDAQQLLDTPLKSRKACWRAAKQVAEASSAPGNPDLADFLDTGLRSAPDSGSLASHARNFFASDTDVEVMVRTLLRNPTPRRVFYAKALLEESLNVFPDSVYCRIVYATFLFNWATEDETLRAVSLLVEASRLPASMDLQYALFARITRVLELRRKMQIGTTGADVDSIGLIEFRKEFREAEHNHLQAIKGLSAWWGAVASSQTDGIAMRDSTVSEKLESIATACHEAEKHYLKLKDRYPQAKALARAYGIFLINARVDELGTTYTRAGEDVDEGHGSRRASGFGGLFGSGAASASGMSGSGPSGTASGTSGGEVARRRQQRLQERLDVKLPVVHSTTRGFRLALVGLVMALVGIFVSTSIVFGTLRLSIETMDSAGMRRKFTESAWYAARGLQLMALAGDQERFQALQQHLLEEMETLGTRHAFLFYHGRRFPSIDKVWSNADTVTLTAFNPDVPSASRKWNQSASLWDAGNLFVATASRLARLNMSELVHAPTVPEWRFVMDNSMENMLTAFEGAVELYQNEDRTLIMQQTLVQGSLLGAKVIILSLLAGCVFWPALRSVHSGKSSIRRLVLALPKRLGKHMHRRYKKIERILTELEQAGMTLEDVDPTSQRYQVLKETDFLQRIQGHRRASTVAAEKEAKVLALAAKEGSESRAVSAAPKPGPRPGPKARPKPKARPPGTPRRASAPGVRTGADGKLAPGRQSPALQRRSQSPQPSSTSNVTVMSRRPFHDQLQLRPSHAAEPAAVEAEEGPDSDADLSALLAVDEQDGKSPRGPSMTDEENAAAEAASLVTMADVLQSVTDADELATLVRQRRDAILRGVPVSRAMQTGLDLEGLVDIGARTGSVDSSGSKEEEDDDEDEDGDAPSLPIRSCVVPPELRDLTANSGKSGESALVSACDSGQVPAADRGSASGSSTGGQSGVSGSSADGLEPSTSQATDSGDDESASEASNSLRGDMPSKNVPSSSDASVALPDAGANGASKQVVVGKSSPPVAIIAGPALRGAQPLKPAPILKSGARVAPAPEPIVGLPSSAEERKPPKSALHKGGTVGRQISTGSQRRRGSSKRSPLSRCWRTCCRRRKKAGVRIADGSAAAIRSAPSDNAMVSVLGDSQLRSVTVQALGVLCLLVIAQIVNFFLTIDISVSGSSKPAELNNAGRRRYLAREAFNTARELLINDGEVGTLEELSGRLAATARFYEAVHDGLRHGSEELGLPGAERKHQSLEDLMYGQDPSGFELSTVASLREPGAQVPTDALAAYGLDPLFRLYSTTMTEILQEFSNASSPRPGLNQHRLEAVAKFNLVFDLEKGPLGAGFGKAVSLYKLEGSKEVSTLETLQNSLVGVELMLVLLVYAVVHRIVRKALWDEHLRAVDLQSLVPAFIAGGDPRLAAWRHAVRHHERAHGGKE
ncbi:hypothetical protein FNF27_08038 [Cafeteria roenbergensis]|uniref:TmcB/TmcC TPR repeats domain-containing protein n=1 Tax=Cafeteria roenbergensis TaxID=33653 RepID=A0A5A8DBH6_CAFRO|nr:hypothetical protein FNF27_08038 [Cafeteria roenbergensis]